MLTINDERQKGTMRDNDLKMQLSNDGTKALPPSPIHCSHLFLSARPSVRPIHPTVNEEPTTLLPKLPLILPSKTTKDATTKNYKGRYYQKRVGPKTTFIPFDQHDETTRRSGTTR